MFNTDDELQLLNKYTRSFMKRNKLDFHNSGNMDAKRLGAATTAKRDFVFETAIPEVIGIISKY